MRREIFILLCTVSKYVSVRQPLPQHFLIVLNICTNASATVRNRRVRFLVCSMADTGKRAAWEAILVTWL